MTYSNTMDWYKGSVSLRLDTIASKGKGVLPDTLCAEVLHPLLTPTSPLIHVFLTPANFGRLEQINSAAARTFVHETRIYQKSQSASPELVYEGYAKAFAPLIEYMLDPDVRSELYGIQLHVCTQLSLLSSWSNCEEF
ncbi:hypothetical protein RhiTH_001145 [Rhizoctonia solani]